MHPMNQKLKWDRFKYLCRSIWNKTFVEMAKVANAKSQGGLVKYYWINQINQNDPKAKFSYVQKFGPWDWIIGTGAYVDDIETQITAMEDNTRKEINVIIFSIAIFTLISIIIASIVHNLFIKNTL